MRQNKEMNKKAKIQKKTQKNLYVCKCRSTYI